MNKEIVNQNALLRLMIKKNMEINISVSGISMEPTLFEGDIIHIVSGMYKVGDILVYIYKNNELLVHRYVGMMEEQLLCKGDNSFRIEDIEECAVLGKVDSVEHNGEIYRLPPFPESLAEMSKEIGKLFKKNKYNVFVTQNELLYKEFCAAMRGYVAFRNDNGKVIQSHIESIGKTC